MTAHEEFFKDLRVAREAKGASLDDISRTTLIDRKYLEAIERGDEQVLPAAYVRAFIREYAAAIGLNPVDVMKKYDQASGPPPVVPASPEAVPGPVPAPPPASTPRKPWWDNRPLLYTVIGAAVLCIAAVVWDLTSPSSSRDIREIPFKTAVRENEQRLFPGDTAKPQTQTPGAGSDSLVLAAASLDSVWMELSIDGTPPMDYLFPPRVRRQWKAKEKFTLTLGNAGAMVFRLNSLEIGTIGKPGSVVRNYELSRKTLAAPRSAGTNP